MLSYTLKQHLIGNVAASATPPTPGGGIIDRFPLPPAQRFARVMQLWTSMQQKGDLNHDGAITPADAAIALQLAATGSWNPAADVNDDDRVTSLDALMILQAAAGRIEL